MKLNPSAQVLGLTLFECRQELRVSETQHVNFSFPFMSQLNKCSFQVNLQAIFDLADAGVKEQPKHGCCASFLWVFVLLTGLLRI